MSQFLKTAINACAAFLAMSVSAMAQDGSGAASLSGVGAFLMQLQPNLGDNAIVICWDT